MFYIIFILFKIVVEILKYVLVILIRYKWWFLVIVNGSDYKEVNIIKYI